MKKFISYCFLLSLILLISGCTNQKQNQSKNQKRNDLVMNEQTSTEIKDINNAQFDFNEKKIFHY
jgi:PBP1b-binding outer membrane lipoprotein LpoB